MRLHVVHVILEHQRRAGRGGLGRVVDRGQDLIFHLHELLGTLQRLLIPGAHQRHGIAQIVCDLPHGNERGLILDDVAHIILARNVLRRHDTDDAVELLCLAGVDGQHPRARIGRAHRAAVAHTLHIHIVGILSVALHLLRHVNAVHPGADGEIVLCFGDLPLPQHLRRQQDTVNDLDVARAAADVVADGKRGLLAGGVGICVQQRLGADHHAGDAEAALHRAGLAEGPGIDVLFPLAEPLNGQYRPALQLVRLRDAGLGRLAVDEHMAGAARALAAAVLDAGKVQRVAQEADELLIFFTSHGLTVDHKSRHENNSFWKTENVRLLHSLL